ncbi:MAG TPA: RNA-guided pseudouridylation complex pseudouridine synthase subunit Cbf5 [Candidatus Nanoarchaeia archaeon]|nr:RNA-guided pseudouridylation complex pseudouridine synthase subunit Cbf5 [Candidatus Nanoarchaeia archaeon]
MEKKMILRREASSSFGTAPEKRSVEELLACGIVNIDKPAGPSSHQVTAWAREILGAEKTGHSGTLDPGVTGVLPTATNKAVKVLQYLLLAQKEYVGIGHLHKPVEEAKIKKVLEKFIGEITQLPPRKSAVKRQERKRSVYSFEILDIEHQDFLFRVRCQSGTYIRKLIHDVGKELGVTAHMAELRRTAVGSFTEENIASLTDLKDALVFLKEEGNEELLRKIIFPLEKAVEHLPKILVFDTALKSLTHGRDLALPGVASFEEFTVGETVGVFTLREELVAVGKAKIDSSEVLSGEKGIVVETEKVFLEEIK